MTSRTNGLKNILLVISVALLGACGRTSECEFVISPGEGAQANFQNALNSIEEGCLELQEGTYEFSRTVTMDSKSEVTIKGSGRENTILSFAGQISGGDGVLVTNSENIVVRDFTIRDAVGER